MVSLLSIAKVRHIILFICILYESSPVSSQTFSWAKNVTTKLTDGKKVVCDAAGNVFTAGTLYNLPTDMDFSPAVFTLTPGIGNVNTYVAKYNTAGDLLWAKLIFSQNNDNKVTDLKIDSSENVYFIGTFKGTIDFDPGPGTFFLTNTNLNGTVQLFIEKLDSNGNFVWAKQIGDSVAYTLNSSCYVTQSGDLLVISGFNGSMDFDPNAGVYSMSSDINVANTFILKLNTNGQFMWAKSFNGSDNIGTRIITDHMNEIYLTGEFTSALDADPNAGVQYLFGNSSNNVYIIKLDSNANYIWSRKLSSFAYFGDILVNDIYFDRYNNLYYAGEFSDSTDFDPSPASDVHVSNGANDAFVSKLNSNGDYQWTKSYGGSTNDNIKQMTTDSNGYSYLMGRYSSTVDFNPGLGVYNLSTLNALGFTYISKFDSLGNFINVKSFGTPNGNGNIIGQSLCKDLNENIFMTGNFDGTQDFDPGAGVYNLSIATLGGHMFIVKFGFCGTFHDTSMTHCNSINLWGTNYDSSQQFIQMFSDANECDSNINVNLTIIYGPTDTLYQTECNSFTINNVTYTSPGLHVQNYPIGGTCDSLFVINLSLLNPGTINITQTADTLQAYPSGYTYQWLDCTTNLPIVGATDSIFVPSVSGNYKAIVYFGVNCSDTTGCKVISKGESVNDFSLANFSIKPNPTKGYFEIVNKEYKGNLTVKITDIFGNIIFLKEYEQNDKAHFDLSNFSNGLYILEIDAENQNLFFKIVKH